MFGLGKPRPYDRQESLRAAEDFRAKKQPKKAIAELQRILEQDPQDAVAHAKLAPLLVMAGQPREAVPSLLIAAKDLEARGFADKAISLHTQRADIEVTNVEAWEVVSKLHVARGHAPQAIAVLTSAAQRQQGRDGRPRAIQLLGSALALAPDQVELLLTIARLCRKEGKRDDALGYLTHAVKVSSGRSLKRARWTWFALFPGLGTFWRWLRA